MPALSVDSATDAVAPIPRSVGLPLDVPNINRATGLSTDYLNHFNEAVMVLEMLPAMPECVDDLKAWRPRTYCEHFAASSFSHRDAVIASYQSADPAVREALEAASETLNTVLARTRDVMIAYRATPEADELAQRAVAWLKPLIARTAAVINGAAIGTADGRGTQAAIDAMFER